MSIEEKLKEFVQETEIEVQGEMLTIEEALNQHDKGQADLYERIRELEKYTEHLKSK